MKDCRLSNTVLPVWSPIRGQTESRGLLTGVGKTQKKGFKIQIPKDDTKAEPLISNRHVISIKIFQSLWKSLLLIVEERYGKKWPNLAEIAT